MDGLVSAGKTGKGNALYILDLESYVDSMKDENLFQEKKDDYAVMCPICREEKQKEMETKEFEGTAGGGVVTVRLNGKREVLGVTLAEEVVDPDDIETLEDLIAAAVGEALRKVEEASSASMDQITGGLGGFGGGFPF